MDPITAFSLAGTILQFIDSGTRFAGLAWKLYSSETEDTSDHGDLLKITKDLNDILPHLQSTKSGIQTEKNLCQLALDCSKTTARLLAILQKVTIAKNARKRDALKAAFRSICKQNEIEYLQSQLSSFRNQLNLHLLLSLREYASRSVEQQKAALQKLGIIHKQTLSVGGISASILDYIVSRKGTLNNSSDKITSLQQDLLQTIYETDEIKTDKEEPGSSSIHLSQTDRERAESFFIASLQYDNMVDRQSRIATAHETTFRWVLQDNLPQDHQPQTARWSDFREWLESDDQLYWITGKAGSGKSTLMKFLCSPKQPGDALDDLKSGIAQELSRCHPYLEKWAGALGLVVASFYFWNSGMGIQMSGVGLLRTLLCQVLAQRPDIIPVISPKEWESLCFFDRQIVKWASSDLHQLLLRAIESLKNDVKIIFFIDGLDEFYGSHEDLISMVKDLIRDNSHVKVCVASRPWNIFQTAFKQKANLRLEDLTFDDIRNFVQSKFHADREFKNLRRRYPLFADKLMDNIVVKASGVFLWVDLVVASLLAGMRLGDRIEDFQRRLDELPPDLENLYEKILHSLEPFYLEHAAQYFALVESAEAPLTILQFSFADEETPKSAIDMRLGSINPEELSMRVESMNRRLNSRCKGFLETDRGLQSIQDIDMRRPSQLTVQYLHRTVRDFIKSPKAQNFLRPLSTNRDFDPSIQLCVAYLMDMKAWNGQQDHLPIFDGDDEKHPTITNVVHCMKRAASVVNANEGAMVELLDELKNVMNRPHHQEALRKGPSEAQNYTNYVQNFLSGRDFGGRFPSGSFLNIAVIYGVVPYVKARANWGGLVRLPRTSPDSSEQQIQWPLLLEALSVEVPNPKMVECLLDLGADSNFKVSNIDSQTPWNVALNKVTLLYTTDSAIRGSEEFLLAEDKWKQTLVLMFSRGADCGKVPESLLSPISRQILQDLRGERKPGRHNRWSMLSWFRTGGSS